ncbi:hypothetical protein V3C99_007722 [Haemonchus contortus]|uniref:TPX2_importin domain-containing protein n=1 Tax=Haemonchus contortus TaxID=6289 RepID=A0A7I5EB94_HAECO
MNVTIGSDGEHHRYRKNMVYKSLRRSSSKIMANIKKKITEAEKTVRHKRAIRPLNESRSPSPTPHVRIIPPLAVCNKRNVYTTPNVAESSLDGYEFDNDSNILRTPDRAPTPRFFQKKTGVIARLREISTSGLTKKRSQPQQNRASSGVRLAKKLARTKILKIQSPRRPLLNSTVQSTSDYANLSRNDT